MDEQDSLEAKYGPAQAKVTGQSAILTIVSLASSAVLCWFFYERSNYIALAVAAHETQAEIRGNKIVAEQSTRLESKFDEVTYILTLNQAERERLKMNMPDSMRKKLLAQERR